MKGKGIAKSKIFKISRIRKSRKLIQKPTQKLIQRATLKIDLDIDSEEEEEREVGQAGKFPKKRKLEDASRFIDMSAIVDDESIESDGEDIEDLIASDADSDDLTNQPISYALMYKRLEETQTSMETPQEIASRLDKKYALHTKQLARVGDWVRVKSGIYTGDLGKVKISRTRFQITLIPPLNAFKSSDWIQAKASNPPSTESLSPLEPTKIQSARKQALDICSMESSLIIEPTLDEVAVFVENGQDLVDEIEKGVVLKSLEAMEYREKVGFIGGQLKSVTGKVIAVETAFVTVYTTLGAIYHGIVKEANLDTLLVELHANARIVAVTHEMVFKVDARSCVGRENVCDRRIFGDALREGEDDHETLLEEISAVLAICKIKIGWKPVIV
ncbi:UNVERIFIED_CONTAM: hypothetical protein HDU68_010125 [Siphonaria sp. JEL0065]|nr:hypothetical protein HDU68_010125 [Siphonaria sp. JEL0065]